MKVFNVFCLLFCRYTAFFFGPKCIPQYFDIRWNRSEIGWFWPVIVRDKMVASTILLCIFCWIFWNWPLFAPVIWRRCTHLKHFEPICLKYVHLPKPLAATVLGHFVRWFSLQMLRELDSNCTSQMKGEHGWTRNGATGMIFSTTRMDQFAA